MDNLGNRTSVTKRDTAADTYALDSATNRYDASTGGPYDVTCAHDAAGNTTRDKDNYTYWYDYEDRVVLIKKGKFKGSGAFVFSGAGESYNECAYDDLNRLTHVTYHNTQTEVFNMESGQSNECHQARHGRRHLCARQRDEPLRRIRGRAL